MIILQMSLSTSILILAVVVIRALMLYMLPKKTFLFLWGIVLCRLLIPITIPMQFSIITLFAQLLKFTSCQSGAVNSNTGIPPMPLTEHGSAGIKAATDFISHEFLSSSSMIWLIGIIACFLFFILTHLWCRQKYAMALPIKNHFINEWMQEHPTKRTVQIKQSDMITAPLTYGILRPVILLPKAANYTNKCELQYVLAHEYTHIKRFDILTKWILATTLCIHWFNPLVWGAYILANRDIELACDEAVIHLFGGKMKSAYANTLINLEEKKSRLNLLCSNFNKNALEERIMAIMKIKKFSKLPILIAVLLILFTTSAFATIPTYKNDFTNIPPVVEDVITGGNSTNEQNSIIDISTPKIHLYGRGYEEALTILHQLGLSFIIEE